MRIFEYLSAGATLIIAFAVILFTFGAIASVLGAFGVQVHVDPNLYRIMMYAAGATFILSVVFEYVYGLIVGEER